MVLRRLSEVKVSFVRLSGVGASYVNNVNV
jgi:hypothetical protein